LHGVGSIRGKEEEPKLVDMCGYKPAKFHINILSLSENIAKSFKGLLFWLALCIIRYDTISRYLTWNQKLTNRQL